MHAQEPLAGQIGELQTAVAEMKAAFSSALHQLTAPAPTVDGSARPAADGDACTVLRSVREMKVELAALTASLQQLQQGQQSAGRQLRQLLDERDLLLNELCRSGSVSELLRQQLQQPRLQFPSRTSSGCHSNDSGLGQTLEKTAWYGPSDPESGSLPDGPLVSTMVQEYVNGLSRGSDSYESDSSLTVAVNKSFTLSSCLSKRCGLEMDELSETDATERCQEESAASDESERVKVVRELADTERRYCGTLWTIQDTFAEPLSAANVLSDDDLSVLFPAETGQLYEKHCRLLHTLEGRLDGWPWQPLVGDLLRRFISGGDSEVLRMYTTYVSEFPALLSTLYRLCRTSSEFSHFLKSRQHHPGCAGLDLAALLLSPVQRVPRYVLLLKQLLRLTPPEHADHAALQHVLHALKAFLARLNDSMEQSFQLVALNGSSRGTDARAQKPTRRRAGAGWADQTTPGGSGEATTLRRRAKSKPASKPRPAAGVARTGSSSGSEAPPEVGRAAVAAAAAAGAAAARKPRSAAGAKKPFDCKSLPHIKQRRRNQLSAARSETNLQQPDAPSTAHVHPHALLARSVHDLQAETSGGALERLGFEEEVLSEPILGADVTLPRSRPKLQPVQVSGSQTLPRGRTLVVSRHGRSVTPDQRPPSADAAGRADRRKVSLRTIKNMFSLKKRASRFGTLNISASSRELCLPCGDQYTPIRDPAAGEEARTCSTA